MTLNPDWNLLGRQLAGETSAKESAEARAWLERHPREAHALTELDAAARNALRADAAVDVEAALERVKARPGQSPAKRYRSPAGLAGILAAAAVFAFAFLARDRGDATPPMSYATTAAVTDTVRLPDGSTILLAPESRVQVSGRDIDLTGAASIVVAEGAESYAVRAAGAVIRDIGTTFSVRAYRGEPLVVAVAEGRVEISLAATRLVVDSGQVAAVDEWGQLALRQGDAADALAWTRGRLVFRDADMDRVAADLRRWYGVELRVSDSTLRSRRFTGSFAAEPLERVLEVIALTLGAQVERRGDTAIVTPIQHE